MISVIVPVYKVEPYLNQCVESILCQTYSDLEILLIDDGSPDRCGQICDKVTLGRIVELLFTFHDQSETIMIPNLTPGSFEKRLYSMYISYLPKEKTVYPLKMNVDARGSFTELLHTASAGQVSFNISKPGIKKGEHWHNTKLEK